MTIPDYLVKATAERYGSDAAALVEEYIRRWEKDKLPEDNSYLSTELYRLAYPYSQRTKPYRAWALTRTNSSRLLLLISPRQGYSNRPSIKRKLSKGNDQILHDFYYLSC